MKLSKYQGSKLRKCIYIYVYYICTWRLTELAVGAQRTAGEGRTVRERPNPKSETMRDYNLKGALLNPAHARSVKVVEAPSSRSFLSTN